MWARARLRLGSANRYQGGDDVPAQAVATTRHSVQRGWCRCPGCPRSSPGLTAIASELAAAQEDDRGILIMSGSGSHDAGELQPPDHRCPGLALRRSGSLRRADESHPRSGRIVGDLRGRHGLHHQAAQRRQIPRRHADDGGRRALHRPVDPRRERQLPLPRQVHHRWRAGRLGEGRRLHGQGHAAEAVRSLPGQALPRRRDLLHHPAQAHPRAVHRHDDLRLQPAAGRHRSVQVRGVRPRPAAGAGVARRLFPGQARRQAGRSPCLPERAIGAGGPEVG